MKARTGLLLLCCHILAGLSFIACKHPDAGNKSLSLYYKPADTAAVTALLARGSQFAQTNFDSVQYYAAQALSIAQSIGFAKGVGHALDMQSRAHRSQGNYAQAVSLAIQAIHLYDSLHLTADKIRMNNGLADIYKDIGGDTGALEYLQKALDLAREAQHLAEKENDYAGIALSLNQQGIIQRDFSKRIPNEALADTAFALYNRAIHLVEQREEGKEMLGRFYNNISQIYNENYHNYPKALEYLFKAVAINKERNSPFGLSYNYGNISDVYLRTGDYKNAILYARTMLSTTIALKAPYRMVNAYNQLTSVFKQTNEYDSALYYRELRADISDSLNNVTKTGQIAEMQTKFETQKKETQIVELNQSNKIKNERLWLASFVVLILAASLVLLGRQKKKLQQQKEQITQQSDRLQWLMKELHHRVKNNLQIVSSLLNLQSHRLKDDESKIAIRESRSRVQAMSLIHQCLYQLDDVTTVNFRSYMNDLARMLMNTYGYGPDNMDLQINIENEFLDVDMAMPLALLTNEIVTNSFKYAYKEVSRPVLDICLKKGNNQLLLSISDNGPGMSDTNTSTGFGKKLIQVLTRQLQANCTVETSGGTTYLFTIPYSTKKAA